MNKIIIERDILPFVKKPVSYQGNEIGTTHKEITDELIRFLFAFPDLYEVGMSHLGLKIIYSLLNKEEDVWCERTFAPWTDMEEKLREHKLPLFALESMDPIRSFDIVGFTLQYEMSYTNILNMLDLAQIPLLSSQRDENMPLIIAGGPCACNPEPLADFIDLFVIGEGEEVLIQLISLYRKAKLENQSRVDFLIAASHLDGIYVPQFYNVTYKSDGTIDAFEPNIKGLKPIIKKAVVNNIENTYFPEDVIVPYTETIHDRVTVELFRGCGRGCRFCQAGMIYRPVRERSKDCLEQQIQNIIDFTGYEEISLMSLSTGDYPDVEKLIHSLVNKYENQRIGVSLPSLRIDSVSIDMLEEIQKIRKSGITLAPEAGTQRMRDVINKGVSEADLIGTVQSAFSKGWGHIKLYFMIGLPTETEEDILGISDLATKVLNEYYAIPKEERNKSAKIVVSTSCFVPKPFTPFQWMPQNSMNVFLDKQRLLKKSIANRQISYHWHDADVSFYEAVFARGDRRLGSILLKAHEKGCKFDGWNEHFSPLKWEETFIEHKIDPDFYALRERSFDELLPWDFIDMGVTKQFLLREWDKAIQGAFTVDCRFGCGNCGVLNFKEGLKCSGNNKI